MKSKDLIAELQRIDPEGETEVCVGNMDIYTLSMEPSFWDGTLQVLIRNESKKPWYHIDGVQFRTTGSKIFLNTMSVEDVLLNNPEAIVDVSQCQSRAAGIVEWTDKLREESKNINTRAERHLFYEWAKATALADNPAAEILNGDSYLMDEVQRFFKANLSPDDPLIELPNKGGSYADKRKADWSNRFTITQPPFGDWSIEKK